MHLPLKYFRWFVPPSLRHWVHVCERTVLVFRSYIISRFFQLLQHMSRCFQSRMFKNVHSALPCGQNLQLITGNGKRSWSIMIKQQHIRAFFGPVSLRFNRTSMHFAPFDKISTYGFECLWYGTGPILCGDFKIYLWESELFDWGFIINQINSIFYFCMRLTRIRSLLLL